MFIAQTAHESSDYNTLAENLNYSGDRLKIVFPKYFANKDVAKYNRNPAAIANLVYANRMGNGDEASGDGYKYRGRGVLQVTGKANYAHCSEYLFGHEDVLIDEPDLLLMKEHAIGSAEWFWRKNNLMNYSDVAKVTKLINGGLIGLEHRSSLYFRASKLLA